MQRPGTGLGALDYFGHEKDTRITVGAYTPSPPPTNSTSGRKWWAGLGSIKSKLSLHRKPKVPKPTTATQGVPSTNGSKWSRWGGKQITGGFNWLTSKAKSSKRRENPVTANGEGQSAQPSRWRSRLPSMSFLETNRGERGSEKKEKETKKETGGGSGSRAASSHWWNSKARSTQKGEGEKPAKTQTGSKFSFAKPWASVFNRRANKPAKPEKTGSEAEATDTPKGAWWSLSRYTGASKRDAANGEKEDNPKSESFFKRHFGRKNRDESKSGSWTGTDDSSVPSVAPSEVSRTDAGSRGRWFDLRSRLAKNKAGEKSGPEVIIIVDPEDPENTVTPGGGRATGKKSAESTNVDEDEPAKRSFFSLGGSSRRAKGAKTKGANEETQGQTLGKAWYSGVTSGISKAGKAIFRVGKWGDRTISNGASADSTITAPTDNDNVPPPTNQTTNNINGGDTTDESAKNSAKRSFWTWGSAKRDKTKKSRGTGENDDSAGGAQSNGWWKKLTSKRNRSSQEGSEGLLKKRDKTISNGANSKSTAEGDSKSWSVGSLLPSRWSRGGRKSKSPQSERVSEDNGGGTDSKYLDQLIDYRSRYWDTALSEEEREKIREETRQSLQSSRLSKANLSKIARQSKKSGVSPTDYGDDEVAIALATKDVGSGWNWSQMFSGKRDPIHQLEALDLTSKWESHYKKKLEKSKTRVTEVTETDGVTA